MKKRFLNKEIYTAAAGWILGAMLAIFGFLGMMSGYFYPGLALFISGLALIPMVGRIAENLWNLKLTPAKKIVILSAGFFVFGLLGVNSDLSENRTQVAEKRNNPGEITREEGLPENAQNKPEETLKEMTEEESREEPKIASDGQNVQVETAEIAQGGEQNKLYQVMKVVDGDTVSVEIDGKEEVLRLIGINTPETVDPRKPVECFGKEASAKAKEILSGRKVGLEIDATQGERDKYGRLLRYVFLEDGTNFNKMMIEKGYAYEYTYNVPYKYQAEFKEAERRAREEKKGLWADGACGGNSAEAGKNATAASAEDNFDTETAAPPDEKNTGSFSGACAGKTKCGEMKSCEEAKFYLKNCGVSRLDGDKDGVPCETLCR